MLFSPEFFQKRSILVIWTIASMALGVLGGVVFTRAYAQKFIVANRGSITRQSGFQYSNPILTCEIASDKKDFPELQTTEDAIRNFVDAEERTGHASRVAVYLRTLNTGRWIGVNENDTFFPASLGKTLILLAYLKIAEFHPEILSEDITHSRSTDGDDTPSGMLKEGAEYSVNNLLFTMIAHSSNAAMRELGLHAGPDVLRSIRDVYSDLNIPYPDSLDEKNLDFISPKTYSFVFRVLYNGTYLSKKMSDRALELFTKTDFNDGIVAGLPTSMTVAHKFGIGESSGGDQAKELHDCGIVYYPNHPYLLCVMTRGNDYEALKSAIRSISKIMKISTFFIGKTDSAGRPLGETRVFGNTRALIFFNLLWYSWHTRTKSGSRRVS